MRALVAVCVVEEARLAQGAAVVRGAGRFEPLKVCDLAALEQVVATAKGFLLMGGGESPLAAPLKKRKKLIAIGGTPLGEATFWLKELPPPVVMSVLLSQLLPAAPAEAPAFRRKGDM